MQTLDKKIIKWVNPSFLESLETHNCVGENTGWVPHHFKTKDALLPTYIKFHSYGEYIFDWAWAQFYQNNNLNYYPKLLHAIPFTPVNAPKFFGNPQEFEKLAKESFHFYQEHNLSSEHYLFINDNEQKLLESLGFTTKLTHQYHFYNEYESFDEFLSLLKKSRRKNIKKERRTIAESGLMIKRYTKDKITSDILENLYLFYMTTISKKGSYPYLTREFFLSLKEQNTLIISAEKEDDPIAMALFFFCDDVLYGRNWGIKPEAENDYPYLHFELCYYQGIEYCIEKNLSLFEAGAQGEHKLTRGFTPVIIKSAHHIKIPQCYDIIKKDIEQQNLQTKRDIEALREFLPFKNQ